MSENLTKKLDYLQLLERKKELQAKRQKKPGFIFRLSRIFRDVFESIAKYLLFKGGRGGGKSMAIGAHFIEESYSFALQDTVFLCIREIGVSIEDSVYSLISDLIKQAGREHDFEIKKATIRNRRTNIRFVFMGMRVTAGSTFFSQINKIKGKHKISKVWGEEAQDFVEDSLMTLFPTVNRGGKIALEVEWREEEDLTEARFYFSMNPNFERDPIINKIETLSPHSITHVNIFHLEEEFQDKQLVEQSIQEKNEIYYDHVWLGAPSYKIQGYPFANIEKVKIGSKIKCGLMFVDPSFAGGDYTAVTFIGIHNKQLCVWGYCFKLAWNLCIIKIKELCFEHEPLEMWYEDNALFSVPEDMFAEVTVTPDGKKLPGLKILGHTSLGNKENRIFKVAAYTAHRTKLVTNFSNAEYCKNLIEYNIDAEHDDAPDSFASAMIKARIVTDKMKF